MQEPANQNPNNYKKNKFPFLAILLITVIFVFVITFILILLNNNQNTSNQNGSKNSTSQNNVTNRTFLSYTTDKCWNKVLVRNKPGVCPPGTTPNENIPQVCNILYYVWPTECKGEINPEKICQPTTVDLTENEVSQYILWNDNGRQPIDGCK